MPDAIEVIEIDPSPILIEVKRDVAVVEQATGPQGASGIPVSLTVGDEPVDPQVGAMWIET